MGRRQREVALPRTERGTTAKEPESAVGMEATPTEKIPGNCPLPHREVG